MLIRGFSANFRGLHPDAVVYARTAADFARDFANALETNTLAEFRRRTREIAFFALDDLQHIERKRPAQEELCRAIDCLNDIGSHILFSVIAPLQQTRLIPSLISRLEGGLVALVRPPNQSTRRRLLIQCAIDVGLLASEELCDWLLEMILIPGTTYREILHCVQQLNQVAQPGGFVAIDVVRDLLEPTSQQEVTIPVIQTTVARTFQCLTKDLVGTSRRQGITQARSVAMYLARQLTNLSYKEIGGKFGKRDHSTVMHACRKTEKQMTSDGQFASMIEQLRDTLCPLESAGRMESDDNRNTTDEGLSPAPFTSSGSDDDERKTSGKPVSEMLIAVDSLASYQHGQNSD
jgi:chromosomal replication initiator protein